MACWLFYRLTLPGTAIRSLLELSAIYAVVAVSMNLLTGFTGLFSLGQAGFMAIGAYTVAILTIPVDSRASVYYVNGISPAIAKQLN